MSVKSRKPVMLADLSPRADMEREIARLSAALSEALAALEAERARNAAVPVAWMFKVGSRTEFTTCPGKAALALSLRYNPQPLAIIPKDAP